MFHIVQFAKIFQLILADFAMMAITFIMTLILLEGVKPNAETILQLAQKNAMMEIIPMGMDAMLTALLEIVMDVLQLIHFEIQALISALQRVRIRILKILPLLIVRNAITHVVHAPTQHLVTHA